jgi:transcriptional regulator with PAS, ATPase and Fis domain
MDLLLSYSWPGNIRELKNVLEAAFVTSSAIKAAVQVIFLLLAASG